MNFFRIKVSVQYFVSSLQLGALLSFIISETFLTKISELCVSLGGAILIPSMPYSETSSERSTQPAMDKIFEGLENGKQ